MLSLLLLVLGLQLPEIAAIQQDLLQAASQAAQSALQVVGAGQAGSALQEIGAEVTAAKTQSEERAGLLSKQQGYAVQIDKATSKGLDTVDDVETQEAKVKALLQNSGLLEESVKLGPAVLQPYLKKQMKMQPALIIEDFLPVNLGQSLRIQVERGALEERSGLTKRVIPPAVKTFPSTAVHKTSKQHTGNETPEELQAELDDKKAELASQQKLVDLLREQETAAATATATAGGNTEAVAEAQNKMKEYLMKLSSLRSDIEDIEARLAKARSSPEF